MFGCEMNKSECPEGKEICCCECDIEHCEDYCTALSFSAGLSKDKQKKYASECQDSIEIK